ncbi:hypothetical protein HMPREF0208_02896 [Citrobacter koseri]|nr:hypothetical protein HMPREF0208_02896 [Citrobacter koseri]
MNDSCGIHCQAKYPPERYSVVLSGFLIPKTGIDTLFFIITASL